MEKLQIPQLTTEQQAWLSETTQNYNIIYLGFYGSHLYGLSRPESDIDVKGIYIPTQEELILGKADKTVNKKNEDLEIEVELKSIGSFLTSAQCCDTNVMDMLHTPEEFWITSTPSWLSFIGYHSDLYAKNMKGIIGYIKTHAAKYGHKIERLNEMVQLRDVATILDKSETIRTLCLQTNFESFKFIKPIFFTGRQDIAEQEYLEVCGKKYIQTWSINELLIALDKEINRYGQRSTKGLSEKMDTKSLSHALRVLTQLDELLTNNTITLPLKDPAYILKIKQGQIENVQEVMENIDKLYDSCMLKLEQCNFQEEPNIHSMVNCAIKEIF